MFLPYSEDYIEQNYRYRDADGRRFRVSDMTANKPGGDVSYEWTTPGGMKVKPYKGRYWAYSKENMQQMHDAGLIYYRTTGMPMLKHYLDEMPGVPLQTFWDDIKPVISGSEERQRPGCISSIEWCKSAAQKKLWQKARLSAVVFCNLAS